MENHVQLPSELQAAVLACRSPNEQALVGRLVSRNTCMRLSSNRTARFRQPLPPAAGNAAWRPHLRQTVKELLFTDKLRMLSAAAASGSEANLQLAWGLLQPCLHPELLQRQQGFWSPVFYYKYEHELPDPGTAAVQAGHAATVLPWLVRHGCPLDPDNTLEAAAQHCDLAGLQAAWELLGYSSEAAQNAGAYMYLALFRAAGLTRGDQAIAKLTWLSSKVPMAAPRRYRRQLLASAAVGAASGGSLPVLHWLVSQGLELPSTRVDVRALEVTAWVGPRWMLESVQEACVVVQAAALQGGHVAVADWLVDEAGCPLPGEEEVHALTLVWLAAADGGHAEALRWLLGRGVPVDEEPARQAASAGRLEALRFLHTECGAALMTKELFVAAAGSRSLPTAAWLLQAGCPMDPQAYIRAAQEGDADMVVWLAQEARCPWNQGAAAAVRNFWPCTPGTARRGLQRAVGALEEAGCPLLTVGPGLGLLDAKRMRANAAEHGDLWLLRRLQEQLRRLNEDDEFGCFTLAAAAESGCEAVVEWLVGQGCEPGEEYDSDPYIQAGLNGDLGTLECLVWLGVGFGQQLLCVAARSGVALPVLRWLAERGAPWDEDAVEEVEAAACSAKRKGKYGDSVAWLEARLGREVQGPERDSSSSNNNSSSSSSEWEEASSSSSAEGGSGDGSEEGSEGWSSEQGEGAIEGGSGSEGEGQEAGGGGLGDGSESADEGDGAGNRS